MGVRVLGIKLPGPDTDHLSSASAEVKNVWSCTTTQPHALLLYTGWSKCRLVKCLAEWLLVVFCVRVGLSCLAALLIECLISLLVSY